jgi:hypothetical protein
VADEVCPTACLLTRRRFLLRQKQDSAGLAEIAEFVPDSLEFAPAISTASTVALLHSQTQALPHLTGWEFAPSIANVSPRAVTNCLHGGYEMSTILLVILVLLLIGVLPTWPYSTGWGYYPSGGLGLIVVIVLVLLLLGRV